MRAWTAHNRRVIGPLALLTLLALTGCTTRTAGMQAPLAHDHDPLYWRPLDSTVAQTFVVAPAYTALVENDPATDAATLQQRIANLPDDARGSKLVELRIALRPAADLTFDDESTIELRHFDGGPPLLARPLAELTFDDDWAVIEDIPDAAAGDRLAIELRPGNVPSGWEYGYATGPVPYGGEGALLDFESPSPVELDRALGFQTIFEQRTDAGDIIAGGIENVIDGLVGDPLLLGFYAVAVVGGAALVVYRGGWRLGRGGLGGD